MSQESQQDVNRTIFANSNVKVEGWYVAMRSSEIKGKTPKRFNLLGLEFVIYRDSMGNPHVLKAQCSHMGASLADGRIENDCLVCPFHSFKFNSQGECVSMPSDQEKASRYRIPSFPVVERWGQVWFWLGRRPLYSLDVFAQADNKDYTFFKRNKYTPHHHAMIPNVFDLVHFQSVHGVTSDLFEVDFTDDVIRANIIFSVVKNAPWILRVFGFKKIHVKFLSYGGNNYIFELVAPFKFSVLTSYAPRNEGGTLSASVAIFEKAPWYKKWTGIWLVEALVKMRCISDFFADDDKWINNIQFQPRFISTDRYYMDFMKFCNRLKIYSSSVKKHESSIDSQ